MLPWLILYAALMLSLLWLLSFNGLYGQDAFQYLHLSEVYRTLLDGKAYSPSGPGDLEFAVGYPFLAALLQKMGIPVLASLLLISLGSVLFSLYYFERILSLLSPGTRWQSRHLYAVLILGLAPAFFRSGITVMSDAPGLAFVSMALFYGLRSWENFRFKDLCVCAIGAGLALLTRFALGALLVPFLLSLLYVQRRKWLYFIPAFLLGILCLWPHFWIKSGAIFSPLSHSMLQEWSIWNCFSRSFDSANGHSAYLFPNLVYALFGFCHYAYFLLLPLLFLLVKRTDFAHVEQRSIALALIIYLLFLAGIPHQNIRYLLPAYFIILILMFPAWDRMFAYGFYFLKNRYMLPILGFSGLILLAGNAQTLYPIVLRNRLERQISASVRAVVPPGSILFAFDVDVAIRYYLPEYQHFNLWEKQYEIFPSGAYILFNEAKFGTQWAGKTPMENWDRAKAGNGLGLVSEMGDGWGLWRVGRN